MPRARQTIPVILLAAVALASGAVPALAQDGAALVRVDEVRVEDLAQKVAVLGRLVAPQAGQVAARVAGPVEAVHVQVGDRVEPGQVIAELDRRALTAQRDVSRAGLVRAEAALTTAKAELALARQELKRLAGLKKSAAFNQARFDDAQQNVAIIESRVREAEAAIVSAKADLEVDEIDLSFAEIVAPYGGVVTERLTEAGSYARAGDPLVRLVADRDLEIEADVPFQRLSGLTPGTEIGVTLDDGSAHRAVVRAVVPEENPLTRTRAVRLVPEIGETIRPLAADQSVTIYVPAGTPREVTTVHKDAIIKRGPQSLVYLVRKDTAEMRAIVLGEPTGSRYEVLDGLEPGDLVVVRGNERLRPGDKIRIDGAS